jgi:(p)ppGpp synthase/HD superfamily hydrolase
VGIEVYPIFVFQFFIHNSSKEKCDILIIPMILNNKVQKAINISAAYHKDHLRIGLNLPYVVHPFSVAMLVSQYSEDENIFCAALLHDVIEDSTGYSFHQMQEDFGEKVVTLVRAITEDKTGSDSIEKLRSNWEYRKEKYIEGLYNAPTEALIISAADSIHNLRSLIETFNLHGEAFWNCFGSSMEKKLNFYGKVVDFMNEHLDHDITTELNITYTQVLMLFSHDVLSQSFTVPVSY